MSVLNKKLIGCSLIDERCLIDVLEDGTLALGHLEARVLDADGRPIADIVFNGEIRLPWRPAVGHWEWDDCEDEHTNGLLRT